MKSMEISQKIENLEKDGDPSLLTFSHQDAEFKISINKAEAKDKAGEFRLSFYITDDQGNKLGSISGLFIAESRTFISFAAKNNAVEEVLGLQHVPKLIKKAISEMVSNGLFTKWFSSMHLSPGGKKCMNL